MCIIYRGDIMDKYILKSFENMEITVIESDKGKKNIILSNILVTKNGEEKTMEFHIDNVKKEDFNYIIHE